jgi:hypothetical protein
MLKEDIMEENNSPINKLALIVIFILVVVILSFNVYTMF